MMDSGFYCQESCGSKSEMITIGDFGRMNFSGSSGVVNGSSVFSGIVNSCDSLVVDSVPELKIRGGLAVEWSAEEQYKLEESLSKYADEPGIIRYVKIAATLRSKTVRDVALRCRWLARKRRKREELSLWKKCKHKKDKLVETLSTPRASSISKFSVAPFSVSMNYRVLSDDTRVEAVRGSIRHLIEQNSQVLGQISDNICALKLQDNMDLFSQTKNNISAILNNLKCMPGPPLPVSLNEDLANSIFSIKSQTMMFPSSNGMNMKQEPRCW